MSLSWQMAALEVRSQDLAGAGGAFHLVELVHLDLELIHAPVMELHLPYDAQPLAASVHHAQHQVAVPVVLP